MSELMVVERWSDWNLSECDAKAALRVVFERYLFRDEREIEEEATRFVTICAQTDESDAPAEPIRQTDFFINTLNPIAEKGKHLLGGRQPLLKSHTVDGQSIVFIFSAESIGAP